MCLAMPVKIEALLEEDQALVELGGVRTRISVALIEDCRVGDYVILHVGYALSKLSEEEARETIRLFAEAGADEGGIPQSILSGPGDDPA